MMIPLVGEDEWLEVLGRCPAWEPGDAEALVLAPHPDDETLAAGGFIAQQLVRGVKVRVVAVTDGEKAYGASGEAAQQLAAERSEEQAAALRKLTLPEECVVRLRLPDSAVAEHVAELVERLLPLVDAGTHLVAPWTGDFHPDHEACGRAAQEVARRTGARLSFWFFWTWHRGSLELVQSLPLKLLPLTEQEVTMKAAALACHASQLWRSEGDPVLPAELLGPAHRPFEVFLDAGKNA